MYSESEEATERWSGEAFGIGENCSESIGTIAVLDISDDSALAVDSCPESIEEMALSACSVQHCGILLGTANVLP